MGEYGATQVQDGGFNQVLDFVREVPVGVKGFQFSLGLTRFIESF